MTSQKLAFKDLVKAFSPNLCSDPRDKVYGILGLIAEDSRLEVDYSKDVRDVFVDGVSLLINECIQLEHIVATRWRWDEYMSLMQIIKLSIKLSTIMLDKESQSKTLLVVDPRLLAEEILVTFGKHRYQKNTDWTWAGYRIANYINSGQQRELVAPVTYHRIKEALEKGLLPEGSSGTLASVRLALGDSMFHATASETHSIPFSKLPG